MTFYLLFIFVTFCIVMSLRTIFSSYKIKGKRVSIENFLFLVTLYATLMIGFGMIYMLLEMKGFLVVLEENKILVGDFFVRLETFIYFSGMTLFSVGYGDISPIGLGRVVAVIEALIGYTIPAAFVARAVFNRED
jgi:potassium channel LctB